MPSRINESFIIAGMTAALLCAASACGKASDSGGEVSRSWSPPAGDTVMGVPATAVRQAIETRLAAAAPPPVTADQWNHVRRLYASFGQRLLWLSDKGVRHPRVRALLRALATADGDALRLDAYPLAELSRTLRIVADSAAYPTAQQLADADVMLSAAYAGLGENMLTGQFHPASLNQNWHINPMEERVDSALARTLRDADLSVGLALMRPQDPAYDSLRLALVRFRETVRRSGWAAGSVSQGRVLKLGDTASAGRLDSLRARLRAEGFFTDADMAARESIAAAGSAKAVYDSALAGSVARFQAHHGIAVDSMLGGETVDAMNVPARYRLAEIAANLERHRWLPRSLGNRYIIVNVPEFRLVAYDSGKTSLEMKVIVGQEYQDKATPVFSDSMEYVVFRPYWNITPSIAAKEIFPKVQANPDYLAANDMEIFDDHGRRAIRQRPGPKNSLGLVKFIFPNDYNIYLHDTPNDNLFKKDVRAFSHGCIRVEQPAALAQWVLGWPAERVARAMNDGADNQRVVLPSKIPVYITYLTAYVRGGELYFGNDLYERDSKLVEMIDSAATLSPETLQAQQALRAIANQ